MARSKAFVSCCCCCSLRTGVFLMKYADLWRCIFVRLFQASKHATTTKKVFFSWHWWQPAFALEMFTVRCWSPANLRKKNNLPTVHEKRLEKEERGWTWESNWKIQRKKGRRANQDYYIHDNIPYDDQSCVLVCQQSWETEWTVVIGWSLIEFGQPFNPTKTSFRSRSMKRKRQKRERPEENKTLMRSILLFPHLALLNVGPIKLKHWFLRPKINVAGQNTFDGLFDTQLDWGRVTSLVGKETIIIIIILRPWRPS